MKGTGEMAYKLLALIPARGGSKGVPGKNIKLLNGKPLIGWTIETARKVKQLDRIIVSTDDHNIAAIAGDFGAEVPFMRPSDLAGDDTGDGPVYLHALKWLFEHQAYTPDIVVWLRPTAPFRIVDDITGAIKLLVRTRADWVRSVCLVEHHPYWMFRKGDQERLEPFVEGIDIQQYLRRQLLPPAYRLNGAVDVTWSRIVQQKMFYQGDIRGYVMPVERSIDIDTPFDFKLAQFFCSEKIL